MGSRIKSHSALYLLAAMTWSPFGLAQIPAWTRDASARPAAYSRDSRDRDRESSAAQRFREQWMLAFEGVTHAPIDMGIQVGLETPQGLRLSGGYGRVPGAYMNLLTGIAANASSNSYAEAVLENANYVGHTWRAQLGLRPFRALGLYGELGYARLNAEGSLDLASSGIAPLEALGGGYVASTKLDMWLFELGYQAKLGDRFVTALALGAMGTLSARTKIASVEGAPSSNLLDRVATQADAALETYGVVPTLTLRLGFDLI
jgi:hypothetical protein